MQHHGAPTRLLDWTTSPYIAAYFAAEQEHEVDGAVWAVNLTERQRSKASTFPLEEEPQLQWLTNQAQPEIAFRQPQYPTDRMAAQQGVFSVCSAVALDHDLVIRGPQSSSDPNHLRKIVLTAKCKIEVLYQLARMGINGLALFPGADGLGRSVGERLQCRRYEVLQRYSQSYVDLIELRDEGGGTPERQ
jgi:hypothetical protein